MNIVKEDSRFLLVKNKKKFIFPVVAKVRLDNYSTEDFGASALITPVNLSYSYFIATPLGRMQEMSENIFHDIFVRHMKLD